jgi:16S rRNA (cytidine1402-2'-O)-methyltransferase
MNDRGGTLFVVATPIGNMGDVTLRAVETLRSADLVAAEDTRRTRALFAHLGITPKEIVRLDASAGERDIERVTARLVAGESVALVTDAGTPVVSDPGSGLVRAARAAGVRITPIPGVSALTAALSVSGFGTTSFRFVGFLPRSGGERTEALAELASAREVVVFFEAPHRMSRTLADLAEKMPEREIVIARELTKVYEELIVGRLVDIAEREEKREWLGEITVLMGPNETREAPIDEAELEIRIDAEIAKGRRSKEIAELLALETGVQKRAIYELVTSRKKR